MRCRFSGRGLLGTADPASEGPAALRVSGDSGSPVASEIADLVPVLASVVDDGCHAAADKAHALNADRIHRSPPNSEPWFIPPQAHEHLWLADAMHRLSQTFSETTPATALASWALPQEQLGVQRSMPNRSGVRVERYDRIALQRLHFTMYRVSVVVVVVM
jgi:hypothetical protein